MTTDHLTDTCAGIGNFAPQDERDRAMWQRLTAFCAREPKAFDRDPATGHVTGSAFVMSPDMTAVLLTHHAKLDRWLQLGGHCDGVADARFTAQKEAYEESGLARISLLSDHVFDIDIHEIPASNREAAHLHYDVRYLFRAEAGDIRASAESKALAWVPLAELAQYSQAESVLILQEKLARLQSGGA
ncbi:NUDIX hydrolase [Phaeobacter gallaeciensis]|uniref:NUDIX hydrolase n=1 Tax=Phaeobacter gallaeciensis TaxID=60890 RepID=UPI000BBC1B50|nr:NUDIX hydrolase [Phaeobacter gallaeciensis]ATF18134.1 NTP pyrophosphohydrolase [Phaeobacter gallaeciensis]ATF22243.1 NTP pyrophosphohydrolase [Phaeobacter gallaeciensis]